MTAITASDRDTITVVVDRAVPHPGSPTAAATPPTEATWPGPAHGPIATVSGGRLGLRVLLGGLALLYLVNAVTALTDPNPFLSLVPGGEQRRWIGLLIGLNDATVAFLLIASEWGRGRLRPVRAYQGAIVAWAGIWLTLAAVLKGMAL